MGSVAEIKEASNPNPLLAKLLEHPPSGTDSGLAKVLGGKPRTVGAFTDFDRQDTRERLDQSAAARRGQERTGRTTGRFQAQTMAQSKENEEKMLSCRTEAGAKGEEAKPDEPFAGRSGEPGFDEPETGGSE
ncbi:MAG: hypothetical protein ASARMPREDX12_000181 [Alectoria sarmentosa]|nr:MAG: hypothetical protein ASARMPREDX12_000181 [Alectoria sarmentosa]